MIKLKNKRGTILVENVVFIILNLLFLSIVILFLFKQGGGAILMEQSYAKNIALLIDSSKPVMELKLNMAMYYHLTVALQMDGNIITLYLTKSTLQRLMEYMMTQFLAYSLRQTKIKLIYVEMIHKKDIGTIKRLGS